MRDAFVAELLEITKADKRVVLLTGDLGYKLWDKLIESYPNQYVNAGVCEQGMLGLAAGLALCGMRPICYTITAFLLRCYEQLRTDAAYHKLPLIVVGVGSGYSYAGLGPSHHSCEDIAAIRALPGFAVVVPSDPWEVRAALREAVKCDHPVYIRMAKRGEPELRGSYPSGFQIGKAIVLREGRDVAIVSCGAITSEALAAADGLEQCGVHAMVVSMHTIKPLDEGMLREVFRYHKLVVTVEEHGLIGGLGSAVAEWLADNGPQNARLMRIGSPDRFFTEAGERHHALDRLGLTSGHIVKRILTTLSVMG